MSHLPTLITDLALILGASSHYQLRLHTLRQGPSLDPEPTHWLAWLPSKPPDPLPSTVAVTGTHHYNQLPSLYTGAEDLTFAN